MIKNIHFCLLFALIGSCFNDVPIDKQISSSSTTSTTQAPTSPSTALTPSADPKPSPIPEPESKSLDFEIMDKENVCALFTFTSTIRLNETVYHLLDTTKQDNGSNCQTNQTSLILNINGTSDQLHLQLEKTESDKYALNLITLTLSQDNYTSDQTVFNIETDKSYLCNAESKVSMKNSKNETAHLYLKGLKVDAFGTLKTKTFRQPIQCEADFPSNDFVPLAVGCALISLVFIVLIAYIVGRRRSRRLAYTSV